MVSFRLADQLILFCHFLQSVFLQVARLWRCAWPHRCLDLFTAEQDLTLACIGVQQVRSVRQRMRASQDGRDRLPHSQ